MNKRLNIRLLVRLASITLVVLVLLHVIHHFQVGRHAQGFLTRGEKALEKQDYAEGVLYLGRYLLLHPNDKRVEGKYGIALDKVATTPAARWRAYYVLERALRRDPGNVEVRQTLGGLAIRLNRLEAAIQFLEPLREADVDRAELEDTLAWCHLGLGDREQALKFFRAAIRLKPDRVASYEHLARQHLRLDQRTAAERVMDELVSNNKQMASAYVSRARFRENLNRLTEATSDFTKAVALGKSDVNVLLQASAFQLRNGRPDEARPLLEQALRVRDRDVRPVLELARLEHDSGRFAIALKTLENVASEGDPQVIALLAELSLEKGDTGRVDQLLQRLPDDSPFASYVEACKMMREGEWVSALRRLEPLTHTLSNYPGWTGCVWLAIARCHAACHDRVRQLEACQQAVASDPTWRAARVALADALTRSGKLDEACKVWKRLMGETEPPLDGWLTYARTLARRNLEPALIPTGWKEVQGLLDRAEQAKSDPVLLATARAEILALQDQITQAETLLLVELGRLGEKMPLILKLSDLQASRGRLADALLILKKYTTAEARVARIRYVSLLGGRSAEAVTAIEEASRDLDRLSGVDAGVVLRARAEAARARGDLREALEVCRQWCRRCPQDLAAFAMRMELGDRLVSEEDLNEAVAGLRVIEGVNGIRWRCAEVMRLLVQARGNQKESIATTKTVRRLLSEAEALKRETSAGLEQVAMLRGRLNEAVGQTESAISEYLLAFERGERGEGPTYHLVRMLLDRHRLIEADRVLRVMDRDGVSEMPSQELFSLFPLPSPTARKLTPALARIGAEVAVLQRDYPRAVELASRALPGDSGSHVDQLWLADVYDKAGRSAEASRILERLCDRAGDIGDVWVALVRQLVRSGQREKAEDVLPRAQKRLGTSDDGWQLYMAECHEALGKIEQAERFYQLALKASPHDPLVLRRFANFYVAVDQPEKAIPLLATLARSPYELKGHTTWARRVLATMPFQFAILKREMPTQYRKYFQEESLLKWLPTASDAHEETRTERARALLIAAQPGRESEGLKRFEKTLTTRVPLTNEEQLRLVQLRDLAGEPAKADELLTELLKRESFNGQYVAGQVRLHLSRGDRPAASRTLKRLLELEPDTERTRSLQSQCEP